MCILIVLSSYSLACGEIRPGALFERLLEMLDLPSPLPCGFEYHVKSP